MASFTSESIILKQFDLGEADKIISCYTREKGKIRAVARGVRKAKSPISGVMLPFSYNLITFYEGRSLPRINQVKNIYPFSSLREDLKKMALASYLAEIVEKVGMENDPNQQLFDLLLTSFHHLAKETNLGNIDLYFKISLLKILGIQPALDKYLNSQRELLLKEKNYFSIEEGGLILSEAPNHSLVLSGEAVRIFKFILEHGLTAFKRIQISSQAYAELNKVLDLYLIYHLDLKLKSAEFLQLVKDMG